MEFAILILQYVAVWLGLAVVTAGIAQGKNRNGLPWFLWTLFLGLGATFVLVAFAPKLPPAPE